jgi:hypothetical protein
MPGRHINQQQVSLFMTLRIARLWHLDRSGPARHAFGFRDRTLLADLA